MAWEVTDIKRSIRRYLLLTLDDDWTVRLERREVADDARPVGVVQTGALSVLRARESIPQGEVESLLPITISFYPAVPVAPDKPKEGDPPFDVNRQADFAADALKSRLERLFLHGMTVTTDNEDGSKRHWAGPFRVPLWDYDGIPLTGPDRAGPEDPHDVLWVQRESLSVNAIQDPEDDTRYAVVAEFRVTVEEPGRIADPAEGYVVEGLTGRWLPPGYEPPEP